MGLTSERIRRGSRRALLVGRETELTALATLLERRWLVTIVGTAGIGKSRLATEALERLDRPFFACDLTQAVDEDDVLNAIARVLSIEPGEGRATDRLAAVLAAQGGAHLLLDGVDQLPAAAWAATISVFLDACPELHVLATARARLRVDGEAVFPLGPLDLAPAEPGGCSPAELLFLSLAEGVLGRDSREQGRVPEEIRALVRVLDGIPLALEIAASVLNVLSPSEILARGAFLLDAPTPSRSWGGGSLRAALEMSWERLDAEAQRALQACSVFVGDFDLSAAEELVGPGTVDLLGRLCEASLLGSAVHGQRTRFRMFECVRQFASETEGAADVLTAAHAREAEYLGAQATSWVHRGESQDRLLGLEWVYAEESNLVSIAQRAVEGHATQTDEALGAAAGALAGLAWLWMGRGPRAPHARLLDRMELLIRPDLLPQSVAVATFLLAMVNVWRHRGDFVHAARLCDEVMVRARRLPLPYFEGRSLIEQARLARLRGDRERAADLLAEAAALAERVGDDLLRVHVVLSGRLLSALNEPALQEASRLARSIGDPLVTARVELAFGTFCYAEGRMDEALSHLRIVDEASSALRQHTWSGLACLVAGNALAEQGRVAEAQAMFETSLRISLFTAHRRSEAEARGNLALLDFEAGRLDEASEGLATAIELFSRHDPMRLFFSAALAGVEASQPHRVALAVERFVAARNAAERIAPGLVEEIDRFGEMFQVPGVGEDPPASASEYRPTAAAQGAARVARRVRESIRARLARHAVAIGRDGSWFRPPSGPVVSLAARPVLLTLLRELVTARQTSAAVVPREDLMRAIWPDERSSPRSMGNRLSVAISTLRTLGLRVIVTSQQGIALDAKQSIIEEASAEPTAGEGLRERV